MCENGLTKAAKYLSKRKELLSSKDLGANTIK